MPTTKPLQLKTWGPNHVTVTTVQGEVKSRQLSITLTDTDGSIFPLSGYTARLYVVDAKDNKVFLDASISGNVITGEIPFLSSAGPAQVQIDLTNAAGEELKITGITLDVRPSSLDNAENTSGVVSVIIAAIDELQTKLDNGDFIGPQGPQGVSGVYVGEGEMPAGYNVQIDPSGEADVCITKAEADTRYSNALTGMASGTMAHMTDVGIGSLRRLAVQGETIETGTGDKGPDHPYAVDGVVPAAVSAAGKNLIGLESPYQIASSVEGIGSATVERYNNGVTLTMPSASSATWAAERLWWPITAGTYTLQVKMETNDSAFTPNLGVYTKKTLTDTAAALTTVTASGSKTITVGASGYIGLYLHLTMDTGNTGARTVRYYDIQLEPGDTATAYEPYTGATVTLPTLEPLYGDGTVSDEYDAATGIETRRWKRMELDGTESGWRTSPTEYNTKLRYVLPAPDALNPPTTYDMPDITCTHYAAAPPYNNWRSTQSVCVSSGSLAFFDTAYGAQDLASWKAYLAAQKAAGTPVTVVYQLAEPVVTQRDPARVIPPAPVSNVYADQGDVDVTYNRDINMAVKRIATLAGTVNNELYGEAIHLEYEVGGFDASQGGEVKTKVRARPVDKAIFVRKGMRVTGGGTYQVDVTEVDSSGVVVKHLCSYADEYAIQADGYIRYTVKNAANPTAAVTDKDLLLIAENVVILNDNSVDTRLEALEESDRFWVTSGTWDIRHDSSKSKNANGNYDVPANAVLHRDAVTDLLFQKLTWTFRVGTVGAFAFGTRDGSGAANGYYVLVNPADKTLKIYNSDWNGTISIKRNLTIDFDILTGETYYAEIIKTGTLTTELTVKCISAPGKTFSYTHNQLNNKLRGWGGVAFGSAGGVFELVNMTQKAQSEAECEVLLIGDSFLENASSELSSEQAYAYKLREKLGEKLIASGRGGATTASLKNKYTTDFIAAKAKYTVLQIGSNDSLSLTVDTFKANLLELIDRVEENGSIPVLVTIPRRYDTDNTAFISAANVWIKSLGYLYIDEYALLPVDRLLNDTIHPNAEGHDLILSNLMALIPVKGVDYWTTADKAEIVADVLNALPTAEEVEF